MATEHASSVRVAQTKKEARKAKERRVKTIFIMVDGLGDVAVESLGWLTPLQKAITPHMDFIAAHGINGLMDPVQPGLACGSDTAHLNILGYDPRRVYRGRGCFETMGAGLQMREGDVAFKSNFASLDVSTNVVTSRRCDRQFHHWGIPLCEALTGIEIPGFPFIQVVTQWATEHRCVVRLRQTRPTPELPSGRLSDCISGTDPLVDGRALLRCVPVLHDGLEPPGGKTRGLGRSGGHENGGQAAKPDKSKEEAAEAEYTCRVVEAVNKRFCEILAKHPLNKERRAQGRRSSNVVLLRGAGSRIKVTPFVEKFGLNAFVVAPTAIIAGVASSLGMRVLRVPGATGDYSTDLLAKANAVLHTLFATPLSSPSPSTAATTAAGCRWSGEGERGEANGFDFAFLHVKAVDDAGHDKDVALKVHFLQQIDHMIGSIRSRVERLQAFDADLEVMVIITGDHSTPCALGDHSFQPVPFTLCQLPRKQQLERAKPATPVRSQPQLSAPAAVHATGSRKRRRDDDVVGVVDDARSSGHWMLDGVKEFDEISAAQGVLGRFCGDKVMPLLLKVLNSLE